MRRTDKRFSPLREIFEAERPVRKEWREAERPSPEIKQMKHHEAYNREILKKKKKEKQICINNLQSKLQALWAKSVILMQVRQKIRADPILDIRSEITNKYYLEHQRYVGEDIISKSPRYFS